jgi:hypothetical protein
MTLLTAVYNTAAEAPEPEQSPRAALRAHTASYATAVTHNTAQPPPPSTTYPAAAASTSSSAGSRRSGSAADMVLAAIQTTRQRTHAKMAGRARQVGDGKIMLFMSCGWLMINAGQMRWLLLIRLCMWPLHICAWART